MEYIINPEGVNGKGNCPAHCLEEVVLLYGIILDCPNQCPQKN